jgi:hypothetical protein
MAHMGSSAPQAASLLESVVDSLDELFTRTGVAVWAEMVRQARAVSTPTDTARAYERMSQGSAPGTFHDLIISTRNGHAITEIQEPYVNELLATLQSLGRSAAHAVVVDGADARLPDGILDAAARDVFMPLDSPPRRREIMVTLMRCAVCGTTYQLDVGPHYVAARRWALTTAPAWIADSRARDAVAAAMEPMDHEETRRELEAVRPAFDRLGLEAIRLPYNRPDRGQNDRCGTCGADNWLTTHMQFLDSPPRLEPLQG